jgi:hypothetical protein
MDYYQCIAILYPLDHISDTNAITHATPNIQTAIAIYFSCLIIGDLFSQSY